MLTKHMENLRHNILEFYRNDHKAPQALTYLPGFKIALVTWLALITGCTVGFHAILEIGFRATLGVPGPLGRQELAKLLICTIPLWYCIKPLILMGERWFTNLGFLLPGAANAWYPSRRRRLVTIIILANTGMILPLVVWALNWRYATPANFSWLSWVVSLLCAQGNLLAGVSIAAFNYNYEFGDEQTSDGQPSMAVITPPSLNARNDGLVITHLSDLHLTGGQPTLEGAPSPDPQFVKTLTVFGDEIKKSDLILITGDITDSGKPEEWISFFSHYPIDILNKTVIIPGNHDINIAGTSKFQVNDPKMYCRAARLIRMMMAIRAVQGTRAYVVDENNKVVALSSFLDWRLPKLIDFLYSDHELEPIVEVDKIPRYKPEDRFSDAVPMPTKIMAIWNQMFPMAIQVSGETTIYVFDTSKRNFAIVDNAFGHLSTVEKVNPLKRLDILKSDKRFQKMRALYAMHHHIVLPIRPKSCYRRFQARAMVMLDAPHVYQHLHKMAPAVVFHGHRHVHYLFSLENKTQVISAPSTTLGDEFNNEGPGFYQYRIVPEGKRGSSLAGLARYDIPLKNGMLQ